MFQVNQTANQLYCATCGGSRGSNHARDVPGFNAVAEGKKAEHGDTARVLVVNQYVLVEMMC